MASEIQDIRKLSTYYEQLGTLIHHVNYDTLEQAHMRQLRGKAVGVDKVTKEEYETNLDENPKNLVGRMKSFSYEPQPGGEHTFLRLMENETIRYTVIRRQTCPRSYG